MLDWASKCRKCSFIRFLYYNIWKVTVASTCMAPSFNLPIICGKIDLNYWNICMRGIAASPCTMTVEKCFMYLSRQTGLKSYSRCLIQIPYTLLVNLVYWLVRSKSEYLDCPWVTSYPIACRVFGIWLFLIYKLRPCHFRLALREVAMIAHF